MRSAFRRAVDELVYPYAGNRIDKVAGIEARGFILGGAIAHQLSAGFVPIRKKGSCRAIRCASHTVLNMASMKWKCIVTPLKRVSGSFSWMI